MTRMTITRIAKRRETLLATLQQGIAQYDAGEQQLAALKQQLDYLHVAVQTLDGVLAELRADALLSNLLSAPPSI